MPDDVFLLSYWHISWYPVTVSWLLIEISTFSDTLSTWFDKKHLFCFYFFTMPFWRKSDEPPRHLPLPTGPHAVGYQVNITNQLSINEYICHQDVMTPGPAEEGREIQGKIFFPKLTFWYLAIWVQPGNVNMPILGFMAKCSPLGDIKELYWRVSTVRSVCPDLLPERVSSQRDGEQACGQSEAFILTIDKSEAFILAVVLQVSKHAMWPLWSDDDYLIGFVKFMQAMLARQGI